MCVLFPVSFCVVTEENSIASRMLLPLNHGSLVSFKTLESEENFPLIIPFNHRLGFHSPVSLFI